jgi:hypothetical protein
MARQPGGALGGGEGRPVCRVQVVLRAAARIGGTRMGTMGIVRLSGTVQRPGGLLGSGEGGRETLRAAAMSSGMRTGATGGVKTGAWVNFYLSAGGSMGIAFPNFRGRLVQRTEIKQLPSAVFFCSQKLRQVPLARNGSWKLINFRWLLCRPTEVKGPTEVNTIRRIMIL